MAAELDGGVDALAGHFQQAELGDAPHLGAGAVGLDVILQGAFDLGAVLGLLHVDEVHHDQPAQVAQPQLARDLLGGFEVGLEGGLLDGFLLGGLSRVDVDGHQGLGGRDDDRAAGLESHPVFENRRDLVLELELGKKRLVPLVELDHLVVLAGEDVDQLLGLPEHVRLVDQDLRDLRAEGIPDRTDHQGAFLVEQGRGRLLRDLGLDGLPQPQEVLQVLGDHGLGASLAGGAHDDAEIFGDLHFGDDLLQAGALGVVLDLARNPAHRVARHEDDMAARQRDEGREHGALGADGVFGDLDHHPLAALDEAVQGHLAGVVLVVVVRMDVVLLEEPVAFGPVVDEHRLQAGFHARNHSLVDVALGDLPRRAFDAELLQAAVFHGGDPDLLRIAGIDQNLSAHEPFLAGFHLSAGFGQKIPASI